MKNYYSISIPKPCHEDWNIMTPKEKGRFCDSCAKTVINFTKMEDYEIQDFINLNKNNRICGHFKQTQLDSINLHIPSRVLEQQKSFHKIFLLALLIAMGTSLMNCTNKNGDKKKIDSIEIIDNKNKKIIDVSLGIPSLEKVDSIPEKSCSKSNKEIPAPETLVREIELTGDIEIIEPTGLITLELPIDEDLVIGAIQVQSPPEFKNTPQNLSLKEKRDYFSKKVSDFISENFNTKSYSDLKGKQRIATQFKIDTNGKVKDIKIRASHLY